MGQPNQNKTNQNHNGIMASIKPLGQRVLVKRLDAEEVSAGGIVLPDSAQEKPQEAKSSHSAPAEKMKTETKSNSRSRRAIRSLSLNTGERMSKSMEQISSSSTREISSG